MKQEIKEQWVKALRSGDYKQGTERLKSEDKFCCLGVLCDIYNKITNNAEWQNDRFILNGEVKKSNIWTATLPHTVAEWAGIEKERGCLIEVMYNNNARVLSTLNDAYRLSFEEIADIIEEQL